MKRKILFLIGSIYSTFSFAQEFSGQYTAEWQWDMNKNTNWANLLRLDMNIPIGKGNDAFDAATIHVSKTNDPIIDDWQAFSNLDADNMFAAIAVLGYKHEWNSGRFFVGVRTVNEDFFTSDITSLFLNSSCGIFPTYAGEVGDTIKLFSNGVRLDEVTVFGMGGKKKTSMSMSFLDPTTGKLIGNQSRMNSGFDILGLVGLGLSKLFPGKKKSSKREKVRKILDKY